MRRLLAFVAKIAISAALLYLAFTRVDLNAVAERLQQAKIPWLVALLAALSAQFVLIALRWRNIARSCGVYLPPSSALRFVFIAAFFNQTMPSTVGGDAARIWYAARSGAGWQAAAYSVIIDRVFGLAVLLLFGLASLPWLFDLIETHPLGRSAMVGIFAVEGLGVLAVAVFLAVGFIRWPRLTQWWATRHVVGVAAAALNALRHGRTAAAVTGFSLLIHVLTAVAFWCAARAIETPFEFWQALAFVPPVILVTTVPITIAGWGVREGAMMAVFIYAGLPAADGLLVSVLFGAGFFAIGAAGGVIWILNFRQPGKPLPSAPG